MINNIKFKDKVNAYKDKKTTLSIKTSRFKYDCKIIEVKALSVVIQTYIKTFRVERNIVIRDIQTILKIDNINFNNAQQ
jgi:hypothetical protein